MKKKGTVTEVFFQVRILSAYGTQGECIESDFDDFQSIDDASDFATKEIEENKNHYVLPIAAEIFLVKKTLHTVIEGAQ